MPYSDKKEKRKMMKKKKKKKKKLSLLGLVFIVFLLGLMKVDREMKEQIPMYMKKPVYVEVEKPIYIEKEQVVSIEDMGEFEVTYYTAGVESTGKTPSHPTYGITKSGARVEKGVTVAVDPNVIPLGTYLYIEGIGFRVAQDIGGAIKGNSIDIYVPDVKTALEGGRHKARVYVLREDE